MELLSQLSTHEDLESLFSSLKCCLCTEYHHIVIKPRILICGGNACEESIRESMSKHVKCMHCSQSHSIDELQNSYSSDIVNILTEKYIFEELCKRLKNDFKNEITSKGFGEMIEDKVNSLFDFIDKRIKEVTNSIGALKAPLKQDLSEIYAIIEIMLCETYVEIQKGIKCLKPNKQEIENLYDIFILQTRNHEDLLSSYKRDFEQRFDFKASNVKLKKHCILRPIMFYKFKILEIDNAEMFINSSYLERQEKIILLQKHDDSLRILDMRTMKVDVVTRNFIKKPYSLCINDERDEIYLYSLSENKIIVINNKMDLVRSFDASKFSAPYQMAIESDRNGLERLYMTHTNENKVSVWGSRTGVFLEAFDANKPSYIACSAEHIFIISETKWRLCDQRVEIISGDNCVYVFDKHSYIIRKKIVFDDWLGQIGLHIDTNLNIMIVARGYDFKTKMLLNEYYIYKFKRIKNESDQIDWSFYKEKLEFEINDEKFNVIITNSNIIQIYPDRLYVTKF